MAEIKIHYVLRGRPNGGPAPVDRERLPDGYYWQLRDDEPWSGPCDSPEIARHVAESHLADEKKRAEEGPWTYIFPLDGASMRRLRPDEEHNPLDEDLEDVNVATVTRELIQNAGTGGRVLSYRVEIEGSYETLTLEISCPGPDAAADVYRRLLQVAAKYQ